MENIQFKAWQGYLIVFGVLLLIGGSLFAVLAYSPPSVEEKKDAEVSHREYLNSGMPDGQTWDDGNADR